MADSGGYTETRTGKLWKKTKSAPFVPLGILGTVAMIAYGVRQYKNRGDMASSVYLMHYRVRAQGMIVGAMTLGVAYSLLKDYVFDKEGHQHEVEEHYKHLEEIEHQHHHKK